MTLTDAWNELKARVADESRRVASRIGGDQKLALSQLLRPNLPPYVEPLRRVAEPIVAAAALLALVVLGGLGALSVLGLMLALLLIYGIITQVFGIELELGQNTP
ncbi:MAG: hypothetical protein HY903_01950 [Deltaproteobacteria bacterium]|nr:hypothetical protein [Deltaproteobacteria bacterium]